LRFKSLQKNKNSEAEVILTGSYKRLKFKTHKTNLFVLNIFNFK